MAWLVAMRDCVSQFFIIFFFCLLHSRARCHSRLIDSHAQHGLLRVWPALVLCAWGTSDHEVPSYPDCDRTDLFLVQNYPAFLQHLCAVPERVDKSTAAGTMVPEASRIAKWTGIQDRRGGIHNVILPHTRVYHVILPLSSMAWSKSWHGWHRFDLHHTWQCHQLRPGVSNVQLHLLSVQQVVEAAKGRVKCLLKWEIYCFWVETVQETFFSQRALLQLIK